MAKNNIRISKLLSLVLRHQPEAIGLKLDKHGWAEIDELLTLLEKNGDRISRDQLGSIVENDNKNRYAIDADGLRIRANQGHSIEVELGLPAIEPPEILFHGTVKKFLEAIACSGLDAGSRQHVHLSRDRETAINVGKRRGSPIILRVRSAAMHAEGHEFYCSNNGVWLTKHVPVQYIDFP